jgi:hypothetical protein
MSELPHTPPGDGPPPGTRQSLIFGEQPWVKGSNPRDKLPEGDGTAWIADFRDGPCAGAEHTRIFSVGPIWHDIWLAPIPTEAVPDRWAIVGGDGWPLEIAWPDQVHYQLADVVTMAGMHGEPVAYYEETSS